ncbi:MAG: Bax inhibitor-1/YccA family protein [Pseudomonadota bacterium]|jgi:hypothetical protein|nr:Bax inhibitor-1/YccA family protein [Pseudomonadota bacterium]QKK05025.1 MAG: Bax inhibitor-1/YccA family protein [Pseudomonadota bacterium]|tara:strand:- start:583 stop:1311 length:729 start_codon:yes stop_codon:yes gene_type:complete
MSIEPKKHAQSAYDSRSGDVVFDAGLQNHMRSVYNVMMFGLVVTGLAAYAVANIEPLYKAVFETPLRMVALFGPLLFIMFGFTPARISRMTVSAVRMTFYIFSAAFGVSMAYIFHYFSGDSIARVFFITSAMFAGISIYGYTTKKDLTRMGSFLIMGVFGLIAASVVNLFLHSPAVHFAVSFLGVFVFTGLTAFETQRIKESYHSAYAEDENAKMAVVGAFSLYLNFVILFQHMLHLFGGRD